MILYIIRYLSGNINLETFPETFGNLKNLKGLYVFFPLILINIIFILTIN